MWLLKLNFYGNSLKAWFIAIFLMFAAIIVLNVMKGSITKYLTAFAKKTKTDFDNLAADLLSKTKFIFLLALSIYISSYVLILPPPTVKLIKGIIVIIILFQSIIWGNSIISFFIDRYKKRYLEKDAATVTTITAIGFIGKIVFYVLIVMIALDNMGIDITALIAGLGVGGIAVALAVQNILGDLLSSLSIVLDKPFVIGDFIIVNDHLGTVEHIGLKTTRIRSLYGEQIIFSNSDLLKSRIRNYKRMYERRVVFKFGVTYQTPYKKLETIPNMIRTIIEAQPTSRFDRAHFKEYGDSSLDFEVVYYVKDPDYNKYMDIQQAINLAIFSNFEKEGIDFAYPTRTLFINKE